MDSEAVGLMPCGPAPPVAEKGQPSGGRAREVALGYIRECVKPSELEPNVPWSWRFEDFSAWCRLHRREIGMPTGGGVQVAAEGGLWQQRMASVSVLTGLAVCSSEFVLTTLAQHVDCHSGELLQQGFYDCFRAFHGQGALSRGARDGAFAGTTNQAVVGCIVRQLFAGFSRPRQDCVLSCDFKDIACGALKLCGDSEADKLWALFLLFDSDSDGLWSEADMAQFLLSISNCDADAGASRLGNHPAISVLLAGETDASSGTGGMMKVCARYKVGGVFDGNCEKRVWIKTDMHTGDDDEKIVRQLDTIEAVNFETGEVTPGVLSLWKGGKARTGGEVTSADEVCATPGLLKQYLQTSKPGPAGVGIYIRFSMVGVWQVRVHGGGYDAISNPIRAVQRAAKRKRAANKVQGVAPQAGTRDDQGGKQEGR